MSDPISDLKNTFEKAAGEAEIRAKYPDAHILFWDDGSHLVIHLPGGRFRRKDGEAKRIHTTRNGSTGRKA